MERAGLVSESCMSPSSTNMQMMLWCCLSIHHFLKNEEPSWDNVNHLFVQIFHMLHTLSTRCGAMKWYEFQGDPRWSPWKHLPWGLTFITLIFLNVYSCIVQEGASVGLKTSHTFLACLPNVCAVLLWQPKIIYCLERKQWLTCRDIHHHAFLLLLTNTSSKMLIWKWYIYVP